MRDDHGSWLPRGLSLPAVAVLLAACSAACAVGPRPSAVPAAPGPAAAGARYALVLDAGSSGTRLHVYRWRPPAAGQVPRVEATRWVKKVSPGLSAYADDSAAAGRSLEPLLDFAVEALGADPDTLAATPLWLAATGGLREVAEPERGEVLAAVRAALAAGPFDFRDAEVIAGEAEGLYGWITVNYLLGRFGQTGAPATAASSPRDVGGGEATTTTADPERSGTGAAATVGALDLGGASTQITFAPAVPPRQGGAAVALGAASYRVYSHSYLGLGQDRAREAVDSPDCYPRRYPLGDGGEGTGDWTACRAALRELLEAPCAEPPCSSMGVYQPPLAGDFYAFSGYAYTASFFGLGEALDLEALETAGAAYCASDWTAIQARHPDDADSPYLPRYCFNAAYAATLLTDGFGFPMDTRAITVTGRIGDAEVGWTLGYLVYRLAGSAD